MQCQIADSDAGKSKSHIAVEINQLYLEKKAHLVHTEQWNVGNT